MTRTAARAFSLCIVSFSIGRAESVAGLPFANTSQVQNLDWIGERVAETLRESLGSRGVLVLDRDDTREAYRRLQLRERVLLTQASVFKLGEALDAEQVVSGSFAFTSANSGEPDAKGTLKLIA